MDNISISNGIIDEITRERDIFYITVSYSCPKCRCANQTVRLVANRNTQVLDENNNPIPLTWLQTGMVIDATISSAMTRSIPPQATAFLIRVVRQASLEHVIVGRIMDIDPENRSFTTLSDGNFSSLVRFNTSPNTLFLDRMGRRTSFSRLIPGLQVQVRHADFMTASIPPQTTAFEVRII